MDVKLSNSNGVTIVSEEYPDIGYLAIPYIIMTNRDLNLSEKVVIGYILGFINNGKRFKASNGWLVKMTGLSLDSIKRVLMGLEEKGWIERILVDHTRSEIVMGSMWKGGSGKSTLGVVAKSNGGVVAKAHTYNLDNKQVININGETKIIDEVISYFKEVTKRNVRGVDDKTRGRFLKLIKKYGIKDIKLSILNASHDKYLRGQNPQGKDYLTLEYISREMKFLYWFESNSKSIKLEDTFETF